MGMIKEISKSNALRINQILQNVAFYIHCNKCYPIKCVDLCNIINDFNKVHSGGMRATKLVEELERVGLIKILNDDLVVFANKNYLSYFIAQSLNGKVGTEQGVELLKDILRNLCFGINADILLFLSYLTNRTEIIEYILSECDNYLLEWIENDLDNRNLKCLFVDYNAPQIEYPTSKQKAQRTKDIVKTEKQVVQTERLIVTDIYDYNANEIDYYVNKQTKVLKLIEIVSKILPNFEHMLDGKAIERIVDSIYTIPNKLVYYMCKPFDENFKDTVNEIVDYINQKREDNKKLTEADGILLLQDLMTAMILSLYDFSTRLATTESTFDYLMDEKYNKSLSNSLQQSMVLYQTGNFEELGKRLEKIYDQTNITSVKFMVKKIARNYLIYHDIKYVKYGQHFIDKFFPGQKFIDIKKKEVS